MKGEERVESFSYIAITKDGKEKKGSIEAASTEQANASLKSEGLIPISISEQSILSKDINITFGSLVKPRDLSLFCRQILGVISAGVSIIEALSMVSDSTQNKYLKNAIKDTQSGVEKGETLASAMRAQGKIFPPILLNMVEAGESSGSLEVAFLRMSVHFEKDTKLKAMVKKALIYPCVVGVVALAVVVLMLMFVIPKFMDMFDDLGTKMPALTMAVINMSDFMVNYWYVMLATIIFIVVGVKMFQRSSTGEKMLAEISLKIPLFGSLIIKSASSRYARTLSTLMAAGIPLVDGLEITAKTMDNVLLKKALMNAKDEVTRGVPLSTPLRACGYFPPMVCHMTKIGEETGNIEGMLDKLADYYDEEVEMATQALTAAMEPMIIVVMAVIVGVLIAAIMSPMLTMYQGLDNL